MLKLEDRIKPAVPAEVYSATLPSGEGAPFHGLCYYRSFLYVLWLSAFEPDAASKRGVWLVHGSHALGFGSHAWVELPGGVVFDGVQHRFYNRRSYYRLASQAFQKYSSEAACLIVEHLIRSNPVLLDPNYEASRTRAGKPLPAAVERAMFIMSHFNRPIAGEGRSAPTHLNFRFFDAFCGKGMDFDPPKPMMIDARKARELLAAIQ